MLEALHYATRAPISLDLQNGVIRAINPVPGARPDLPFIAPGLVDLQINGYANHDFNATPIAPDALPSAVRLLQRQGVTTFFPTVITNAPDAIADNLATIARAREQDPAVASTVPGVHLEGPFISAEEGPRGAHARDHVRSPDWDLFQRWQDAARGLIRILTLSPEWPDAPRFIERATAAGVTVSIGHTAATPAQVADAVRAGARMSTHFGNGAHLTLPRHPNYLWEQLAQDELHTCVIADGFHVPDQLLKVVLKVKRGRAMLVSDAVSLAGLPPGAYTTPVGGRVVLTPAGRLHLADNDKLLAGSAQLLLQGVEHVNRAGLCNLADGWDMASLRPGAFMKLPQSPGLVPGAPADLVLFRQQGDAIQIERTYKSGEAV
jgi:N-acetylglucosamine-6-phosphate deacetylase